MVVSFKTHPGPLVLTLFPWRSSLFLWIIQKDSSPLLSARVMVLWGQEKASEQSLHWTPRNVAALTWKCGISRRFKRVGLGFKTCLGKKVGNWFCRRCFLASPLPRWWLTPTSVPLPASWRACPRAAAWTRPPSTPPRIPSEFLLSCRAGVDFWAGERVQGGLSHCFSL